MSGKSCKGSQWDLFLFLNTPRVDNHLEAIPEEGIPEGDHHCPGSTIGKNMTRDFLGVSQITSKESPSPFDKTPSTRHERIPSMTYVSNSQSSRSNGGRKHWDHTMYRSFSQLDLRDDRKRDHDGIDRSRINLPPIKMDNSHQTNGQSTMSRQRMTNGHQDKRKMRRPQRDPTIEWVVSKPPRLRPKDHNIFEKPPEPSSRTYVRPIHDSERRIEPQPGILHISRSSHFRPSTSLKPGGEGYFQTVSRDSYKRFVIVDVNNNEKESKVKVNEVTVDGKGQIVERKTVSQTREFNGKPEVETEEGSSRMERNWDKACQVSVSESPKLDKEIQVDVNGVDKSKQIDEKEPNMRSRRRDKQEHDEVRTFHSSLPRRNRHKNDSQITFDHVGYKDVPPTRVTRHKGPRRDRNVRDLFKESEDFWTMENVDGKSSYQTFFKERSLCPVLDLEDRHKTDYKFKNEVAGHKYYYICDRL